MMKDSLLIAQCVILTPVIALRRQINFLPPGCVPLPTLLTGMYCRQILATDIFSFQKQPLPYDDPDKVPNEWDRMLPFKLQTFITAEMFSKHALF